MQRDIQAILKQDIAELENTLQLDSGSARIEVQCLLQQVLGVARAYLMAHPERVLTDAENSTYRDFFQRRLAGEPIAYIFGQREFFGLNFKVTSATLIPRSDTELLVELALQLIPPFNASPLQGGAGHAAKSASRQVAADLLPTEGCRAGSARVLDLGTGSGAIALAIAHQRPDVEVWACDASIAALRVAQENAQRLAIANVHFIESDWLSALGERSYDLIVSNPPYIAAADPHLAQGDVRFEPLSALVAGADGLDDIRHIVKQAALHLEKNGWLLLEHGYDQAAPVRELLRAAGFAEVFSAKDLSGIERCSGGKING